MSNTAFQKNNRKPEGPKIIKKYGNRKLYDTEQSSYVVLKDIEKMIRNKEDIQIIDNETQHDITVPTLTQIIFSSEKKSKVSVPVNILTSIIREGDGSFSSFLSKLGLFTGSKDSESYSMPANLSPEKKKLIQENQSLEQKISRLMNGNTDLHGNDSHLDNKVPKLPRSQSLV